MLASETKQRKRYKMQTRLKQLARSVAGITFETEAPIRFGSTVLADDIRQAALSDKAFDKHNAIEIDSMYNVGAKWVLEQIEQQRLLLKKKSVQYD
jgi:hypothetical protein